MVRNSLVAALLAVSVAFVGCNQPTKENQPSQASKNNEKAGDKTAGNSLDGKQYLLAVEPKDAKGIIEARKVVKDGDPVVVVGRIAGSVKPFVEGRASFSVTDLKIEPCGADEGCPTPWDCCCTPKEDLLPAMAQVKFEGTDGKTLNVSAKELLGVKELAVVVVAGKANRDEKGNLTVVASGLHVRNVK